MNGYANAVTYQLTEWEDPDSTIEIGSGERVTYNRWIRGEQLRISAHPDRMADIRFSGNGYIALFVNPWKTTSLTSWQITAVEHDDRRTH